MKTVRKGQRDDSGLSVSIVDQPRRIVLIGDPLTAAHTNGTPRNHFAAMFVPGDLSKPVVVATSDKRHRGAIFEAVKFLSNAGIGETDVAMAVLSESPEKLFHVDLSMFESDTEPGAVDVFIRPKKEAVGHPGIYRQAMDLLKAVGVADDRIGFLGAADPKRRAIVQHIGCVNRLTPILFKDDHVREYIRRHHIAMGTLNRYYYTPSEGTRRISADGVVDMLKSLTEIDNDEAEPDPKRKEPRVFIRRMREVVDSYRQQNNQELAEVDFLLFNDAGKILKHRASSTGAVEGPTVPLYERFCEIYERARAKTDWTPIDHTQTAEELRDFAHHFRSLNPKDLKVDDPSNHRFLHTVYTVQRGFPQEAELLGLGPEFLGNLSARAGGFIGSKALEQTPSGGRVLYRVGAQPLSELDASIRAAIRTRRKKAKMKSGFFTVDDLGKIGVDSDSAISFTVTGPNEDDVLARHWVFDEDASDETKATLNNLLISCSNLRFGYACEVPQRRAWWDMLVEEARTFGKPYGGKGEREVDIVVFREEDDQQVTRLYNRRVKRDAGYWVANGETLAEGQRRVREYAFYVSDRLEALRWLGVDVPDLDIYHIPAVDAVGRKTEKSYASRVYVEGESARMRMGFFRHTDAVRALFKLKGWQAGGQIASCSELFEEELFVGGFVGNVPHTITLADTTSAFSEVGKSFVSAAPLYGARMAADLLKARFMGESVGTLEELGASFIKAFVRKFTGLQEKLASDPAGSQCLIHDKYDSECAENDRKKPTVGFWNMLEKWPKVLKQIHETDAVELGDKVRKTAARVYEVGYSLVRDIPSNEDKERVLEAFIMAVSVNHRHYESLLGVISADKQMSSADVSGKLQRINFLRAATWITRTGHNVDDVQKLANAIAASGADVGQAPQFFYERANQQFPNLHINRDNARAFYDVAADPRLYGYFKQQGYIMDLSHTQDLSNLGL